MFEVIETAAAPQMASESKTPSWGAKKSSFGVHGLLAQAQPPETHG